MTLSATPTYLIEDDGLVSINGSDKNSSYCVRELILDAVRRESTITSFYKDLLRNLLSAFSRFSVRDNEGKLRVIKCVHGSPERAIGNKVKDDNRILPILGLEQNNTEDDEEKRRFNPLISTESHWDDVKQRAYRVVTLVPKAVKIEYTISVWCQYKEDLDQLTEQIHRTFNPSTDLNTPLLNYGRVFLSKEYNSSTKEMADKEDRVLIRDFTITIETYIPYPKFLFTSTGQIQRINLDIGVGNSVLDTVDDTVTEEGLPNLAQLVVPGPLNDSDQDIILGGL